MALLPHLPIYRAIYRSIYLSIHLHPNFYAGLGLQGLGSSQAQDSIEYVEYRFDALCCGAC